MGATHSSKTLLVRADSSPNIGAGHVMRCIAIAQAWADRGGKVIFASHGANEKISDRIEQEGFELYRLQATPNSREDAKETRQVANRTGASWCVVDGYEFESDYLHAVSEGNKLLRVDDYEESAVPEANLTLNPNYDLGDKAAQAGFLHGVEYILLRRSLRGTPKHRTPRSAAQEIMVTFGGSDPEAVTLKTIRAIESLNRPGLHVSVVVGALNSKRDTIETACRNSTSQVKFDAVVDASDEEMARLMAQADLCLIAAGNTLWEAMHAGLPVLSYAHTSYQKELLEALDSDERVRFAGKTSSLDEDDLTAHIRAMIDDRTLREALAEQARKFIDGKGADRIANRMLSGRADR